MLQRNKTILWRELDQEVVLLDPMAGCSYTLNAVGAFIWNRLDGEHTTDEIAAAICEVYEVTYKQALQDIESMLVVLCKHNLVAGSAMPAQNVAL
jgi:hypothetical protein